MVKVFGLNTFELCSGVNGEDFERFWLEEFAPPCEEKLGWVSHLLKADEGERAGRCAVIWEAPSVASRDRYTLPTGGVSEEGLRALSPTFGPLGEKLDKLTRDWVNTDYVEIGK